MERLNRQPLTCETLYNTVRPYQALGYLTPSNSSGNGMSTMPDKDGMPLRYRTNKLP